MDSLALLHEAVKFFKLSEALFRPFGTMLLLHFLNFVHNFFITLSMIRQVVQDGNSRGGGQMNRNNTQKELLIGKFLECLCPSASRSDEPLYPIAMACAVALSGHPLFINWTNDLSCAFTIG